MAGRLGWATLLACVVCVGFSKRYGNECSNSFRGSTHAGPQLAPFVIKIQIQAVAVDRLRQLPFPSSHTPHNAHGPKFLSILTGVGVMAAANPFVWRIFMRSFVCLCSSKDVIYASACASRTHTHNSSFQLVEIFLGKDDSKR